ncbi:serine/threonine protein kinase [Salinispira pacifica]
MQSLGTFDLLTPDAVLAAVEGAFGIELDGAIVPYPSYINRVFGLRTPEGGRVVAKFYRPGRWSPEAIEEEHRFITELAAAEIPVVAPIADSDGETIAELSVGNGREETEYQFALFPLRGGRNFDPESDEDWLRLGSVVGRIHAVGRLESAPHRLTCLPGSITASSVAELLEQEVVHPEVGAEFEQITAQVLDLIRPAFEGLPLQRLHGDCHRGNILDRPGEGLLVIDFDDMMNGPPVQDIWLLLPGRADESRRELALLVEGYEQFSDFDRSSLRLIEPLRFMRMLYFLAWRSRQRNDNWFRREFPDWGGKAFWIREIEDLREQALHVAHALRE